MKKLLLLSALFIFACSYSQDSSLPDWIPADGLYGYWPLNGTSGADDLSGNENHGTTNGLYSIDTFENGDESVYLENQMIILPSNSELDIDNFTIQFWTKAVSYNIHNKVQFGTIGGGWRWGLNWADSTSPLYNGRYLYYAPGECDGSYAESLNDIDNLVSIDRNIWHLLTYVIEGQQTSFYVNGNLITVSNVASDLSCYDNNMSVYFGGDIGGGSTEYYNGWFDNIGIWTRPLTQNEVENIHSSSTLSLSHKNKLDISIYPNPTDNQLFVQGHKNSTSISVFNLLGKKVLSKSNVDKIDVSELSNGVYFIKISDGINSSTKKFIKN